MLFCCLWRNAETFCHQQTPPLTTNEVSQLAGRWLVRRRRIDNTWLVAASTACSKLRYWLRIETSAYHTWFGALVKGGGASEYCCTVSSSSSSGGTPSGEHSRLHNWTPFGAILCAKPRRFEANVGRLQVRLAAILNSKNFNFWWRDCNRVQYLM